LAIKQINKIFSCDTVDELRQIQVSGTMLAFVNSPNVKAYLYSNGKWRLVNGYTDSVGREIALSPIVESLLAPINPEIGMIWIEPKN